jgi:hypothetical protein
MQYTKMVSSDNMDDFFKDWKISSKGNYYGIVGDFVYVISNIDHDTNEKLGYYHTVFSSVGKKNYKLLERCSSFEEAKKNLFIHLTRCNYPMIKKDRFEI